MQADKEYVDVDSALKRIGGNKALYIKLLKRFLEENGIDELEQALSDADMEKAARSAHSIKGTSANLSLGKLTQSALALEQAIKAGADHGAELTALKECFAVTSENASIVIEQ